MVSLERRQESAYVTIYIVNCASYLLGSDGGSVLVRKESRPDAGRTDAVVPPVGIPIVAAGFNIVGCHIAVGQTKHGEQRRGVHTRANPAARNIYIRRQKETTNMDVNSDKCTEASKNTYSFHLGRSPGCRKQVRSNRHGICRRPCPCCTRPCSNKGENHALCRQRWVHQTKRDPSIIANTNKSKRFHFKSQEVDK